MSDPRRNLQVILTTDRKIALIRGADDVKYGPYKLNSQSLFQKINSLPGLVDAAFTSPLPMRKGSSLESHVLFVGESYYFLQDFQLRVGPFSIHGGPYGRYTSYNQFNFNLPSYVKKIDAAMLYRVNKRIYLFSGTQYWRFRYNNNYNQMDSGYPRSIRQGFGTAMPERVDGAISQDKLGFTYFVRNEKLYKFDERNVRVEQGYPQHKGYSWLNCGGENARLQTAQLQVANSLRVPDDNRREDP